MGWSLWCGWLAGVAVLDPSSVGLWLIALASCGLDPSYPWQFPVSDFVLMHGPRAVVLC